MKKSIKKELKLFKQKIIKETAKKLFKQKGFLNTTINDIAKEVGFAKGSIYNYFNSKDEIFLNILDDHIIKSREGLTSILKEKDLSPKEKIEKFLRVHVREILLSLSETISSFYQKNEDAFFVDGIRFFDYTQEKINELIIKDVERVIKEGQELGEITNNIDSYTLSILLYSYNYGFFGFILKTKKNLKEEEFERFLEDHIKLIIMSIEQK